MRNILIWIGNIFKRISRVIYHLAGGICWYCGKDAGFNSVITRGRFWCECCYSINKPYLNHPKFEVKFGEIYLTGEAK